MARSKASSPTQWDLLTAQTAPDDVTVIIRGHLVMEALLNRLLGLVVPPMCDELDRLRFAQKLDLAIALGALTPDVRASWRQVNTLRNRFAHDLSAELTQRDADDLLNAMPKTMRIEIRSQRKTLDDLGRTGHRSPRALAANCIGWLATFASREIVKRGGTPMEPVWPHDED